MLLAIRGIHSRKVIHRDLKPDNLFLVEMENEPHLWVKIGDFGLSRRDISELDNALITKGVDNSWLDLIMSDQVTQAKTMTNMIGTPL